jgi:type III HopA1-like effector protein
MKGYRDQVGAVLRAVEIRAPTRYAWLGRPSRPIEAAVEMELDASVRREFLVTSLREELYFSFYCRGTVTAARWREPGPMFPDDRLVAAIVAANAGGGTWEPGWTVEGVDRDEVVVATPRLRMRVRAADCRRPHGPIGEGAGVAVRMPGALPARSPGFCMLLGDAIMDPEEDPGLVRVYWSVARAAAIDLVRALTTRLNAVEVPFRLKVADHRAHFDRCDAAVLYLPSGVFRDVAGLLRAVAGDLAWGLRAAVPAFTLPLAPGVALAESAADGESFGVRRCAWVADAIVRAHELGCREARARIALVADRFADDGVDLDVPYLEPTLAGRHVL